MGLFTISDCREPTEARLVRIARDAWGVRLADGRSVSVGALRHGSVALIHDGSATDRAEGASLVDAVRYLLDKRRDPGAAELLLVAASNVVHDVSSDLARDRRRRRHDDDGPRAFGRSGASHLPDGERTRLESLSRRLRGELSLAATLLPRPPDAPATPEQAPPPLP